MYRTGYTLIPCTFQVNLSRFAQPSSSDGLCSYIFYDCRFEYHVHVTLQ